MRFGRCFRFLPCSSMVVFTLMLGMLGGCGAKSPYDYVKVSGKVTFEDGSPINAGEVKVVFVPQDVPQTTDGPKPRPGTADVNVEDGTFDVVTSYRYGDGILPGKHRVMVIVLNPQKPSEVLPTEYADPEATPLEVNSDDSPFDLKVKRRAAT